MPDPTALAILVPLSQAAIEAVNHRANRHVVMDGQHPGTASCVIKIDIPLLFGRQFVTCGTSRSCEIHIPGAHNNGVAAVHFALGVDPITFCFTILALDELQPLKLVNAEPCLLHTPSPVLCPAEIIFGADDQFHFRLEAARYEEASEEQELWFQRYTQSTAKRIAGPMLEVEHTLKRTADAMDTAMEIESAPPETSPPKRRRITKAGARSNVTALR